MSDTLPQPFGYIMIDIHGNACEVLGYTAEQLAAAVAEATKRLQIELENVRAEGLLLAKSAEAMERERWQADAERYRWLRDKMDDDNSDRVHDDTGGRLLSGAALDAALDLVTASRSTAIRAG